MGHDLGLSVVGGSHLTNRGEIRERESVGGTTLEKTPLWLSVGFLAVLLNALVLA